MTVQRIPQGDIVFQFFILSIFAFITIIQAASALPVDLHGKFLVDMTAYEQYRRLEQKSQNTTIGQGSQEVGLAAGEHSTMAFQSYIMTLEPHIIVNDSTTLKGEISSGYARGGLVGENTTQNKQASMANSLYYYNTSDGQNALVLNQFYAEFYADTATYIVGRHSENWGLGALYNSGEKPWDRHFYSRDGVTAKIKLGNFNISPYFARSGSESSLTRATRAKEYGASVLYDNTERELAFGLLYGKKENATFASTMRADITADNVNNPTNLGRAEVKIVDLFFKKSFGKFSLAAEIPLMNGEIGHLYNSTSDSKYKAKGFIFEADYKINSIWTTALDFGKATGHSGSLSSFEALYLNPNYQVANILFRYNLSAVADTNQSIFDSYIVNAKYAKLEVNYMNDKWNWRSAFIYAKADQTAKKNQWNFNHSNNKLFYGNSDQSDDLGYEVDSNLDYFWNKEVLLGLAFGYHFVGDYYKFSNDTSRNLETKNGLLLSVRASVNF